MTKLQDKMVRDYKERLEDTLYKALKGIVAKKYQYYMLMDIADHISMCNAYLAGKYSIARRIIRSLDTSSYEAIPLKIYNLIY